MALTIENGTRVAGADSYASLDFIRSYAAARGLSFPESDDEAEPLAIQAMDLIESFRDKYQGSKVAKDQSCQFPRVGVQVDGFEIGDDEIPEILLKAQAQLAIDAQETPLMQNSDGRQIVREKIEGVSEYQYAEADGSNPQPVFAAAEALLAPLFGKGPERSSVRLRVVRA